jgi:hypothetical protein
MKRSAAMILPFARVRGLGRMPSRSSDAASSRIETIQKRLYWVKRIDNRLSQCAGLAPSIISPLALMALPGKSG